jgi:hypothetical protein
VDLMEALKKSLAKQATPKQAPVEMKPMKAAVPEALPTPKRAGKRSAS